MQVKTYIALLAFAAGAAHAQIVDIKDAWARATVPGQKATGVYMKLTARQGAVLVGGSSPVAGVTEVHEMKMDNGVMMMRAMSKLDLPAGKTVELKPGGYHMMMLDLNTTLSKDGTVPLTLVFKDAKGAQSQVELQVPVVASGMPMGGHGQMKH